MIRQSRTGAVRGALGLGATIALGTVLGAHASNTLSGGSNSAAATVAVDAAIGHTAPDFSLRSLDGRLLRLSQFRGQVVLLNFWATWCAACRVEMPWLEEFQTRYRQQGLRILGLSVDDDTRDRVVQLVHDRRLSYPILLADEPLQRRYGGVSVVPQTIFVGRDGTLLRRVYGIRTRSALEAEIRRALGLKPLPQ